MSYRNEILKNTGLNEEVDFTEDDVRRTYKKLDGITDKLEEIQKEMEEVTEESKAYQNGNSNVLKGAKAFDRAKSHLDKALIEAKKASFAGFGKMPKEDSGDEGDSYKPVE